MPLGFRGQARQARMSEVQTEGASGHHEVWGWQKVIEGDRRQEVMWDWPNRWNTETKRSQIPQWWETWAANVEKGCCCSLAQSCPTLCDPVDCSTPGFPGHHQLPWACSNSRPSSRWCHPTILSSNLPFSSCLQSFPASGSFLLSQFSASGGQSIGVSASASVLPTNIQDLFPLGWTGWISL